MPRVQTSQVLFAAAFETNYGSAPVSGYTRLPFISSTLGASQALLDSDILGLGRDPEAPVLDAVVAEGDVDVPLGPVSLGFWLKLAFGAPVTTQGEDGQGDPNGVYTHVFTAGSYDLPSMAVELRYPPVPRHALYAGCKLDVLQWEMTRSGQQQARVSLVPQGETVATAPQTGSLDTLDEQRLGAFHGAIKRNGSALANIESARFEYRNNLDRIETIRSDGLIDGADPGIAACMGQLVARLADNTLYDQAIAGTSCELEFSYTRSASESVTVEIPAVFLPRPRTELSGPGGVRTTFDWQAARPGSGDPFVKITLVNNRASY